MALSCNDMFLETYFSSVETVVVLLVSLSQLQAEAERLEELKIKNMQNVIEAIRAEIALFWERCYYSSEQKQAFIPYFDGKVNILVCILYPSFS